jgi:hypothetical protein
VTGAQTGSDEALREQIRAAVEAIDGALGGIVGFLAPLKPTLRNELIQLLGDKVERARAAKESLEKLLADLERGEDG